MAVALASASPATGATEVLPNQSVRINLTDSSALDEALIEVLVDGISYTVANGGLVWWDAGTAMEDLWTDTQEHAWWAGQVEVSVVVKYNSATLSTLTWSVATGEPAIAAAWLGYQSLDLSSFTQGVGAWLGYSVWDTYLGNVNGEVAYVISTGIDSSMDVRYLIGVRLGFDCPASGIVGESIWSDTPGSGMVQGWTWNDTPCSGIVQGWTWNDTPTSGIVGNPLQTDSPASGIVGIATRTDTPGAGVVYAVNRRTAIDVQVAATAYTATLTGLGITWS